jgi:hypothetical protein
MRNKNCLWAALLCLLGMAACRKTEIPPSGVEPSPFDVTFQFGGTPGRAFIGEENGYYHYADFGQGSDAVLTFSGTFAPTGCPDGSCPSSLRFEFRNGALGGQLSDSLLVEGGFLSYRQLDLPTVWRLDVQASPNTGYYTQYQWFIPGVGEALGSNATFFLIGEAPRQVFLSGFEGNLLLADSERRVSITGPSNQFPQLAIQVGQDSFSIFDLSAQASGGQPPYQYLWSTGDTMSVIEAGQPDSILSLRLTDAQDNLANAALYNLLPGLRTPTFTYAVTEISGSDSLQLATVAIQWVDEEGLRWRSDLGAQPNALFRILDAEPYENNEKGQKTRLLHISFDCLLFNANGQSRPFSGSGKIAVALP